MISKYSLTISIMLYSAFYVLFFPLGIFITIFGFIFQYWLSKVFVWQFKLIVPHDHPIQSSSSQR